MKREAKVLKILEGNKSVFNLL